MSALEQLSEELRLITDKLSNLSNEMVVREMSSEQVASADPFVFAMTIFVLACFVGYFVIWKVTPSLHTPLMALTNAISSIIIVGAILAVGPEGLGLSQTVGFIAVLLASINIFGGFVVTQRMLAMFKKKER